MKFRLLLLALLCWTAAVCAQTPTPISNLNQISTPIGTELFPLQLGNGQPASVNTANLANYVLQQLSLIRITSLWLPPCNSVTFLRGDGQCVPAGSGSGIGNVYTTGLPASGNLTQFSGSASVTNGDLSGDCATAGTLVVACGKTNGVPFGVLATGAVPSPTTGWLQYTGTAYVWSATSPGELTGTGTLTYTSGCSSGSIAPTYSYAIVGQTATITMTSAATCVLSGVTFVVGGLPSALQPTAARYVSMIGSENGAIFPGYCLFINSAAVNCGFFGMSSGASGFFVGSSLTYTVN